MIYLRIIKYTVHTTKLLQCDKAVWLLSRWTPVLLGNEHDEQSANP